MLGNYWESLFEGVEHPIPRMKAFRLCVLPLVVASLMQLSLSAQAVTFLVVGKRHVYTQTDNSTTADASNPWRFDAHIEGTSSTTDLSGITTPTLGLAGGTGSNTLTYNSGDNAWQVQASYSS